jgi:2-(1,2-epoxy-1,2-dihydrophenyl)acetyl-CoA isomerase
MVSVVSVPPGSYRELVELGESSDRVVVRCERTADGVALIRLDEPESLNPLNPALTLQLRGHLETLAADLTVRAVILTGTDPAFSAGGDLRSMHEVVHPAVDNSFEGATAMWRWIRHEFSAIARLITRTDKLFVAAVNGVAAGVGLAFAQACDLVIASERAQLVTAFGRVGLIPEVGLGWALTRSVGYHKTMELFLDGRPLDAHAALELGLVNEVVAHDELLDRAHHWCARALEMAPHSFEMTKPLLRSVADLSWDHAITMEEFAEPACFTTQGHRDAVARLLARSDANRDLE